MLLLIKFLLTLWHYPAVKIAGLLLACVFLIHLASALTLDRNIEYKEISYGAPTVRPALEGYRVAFLTDIHGYPEQKLKDMVDAINSRGTDLVVLGGDFSGQKDLSHCLAILSGIEAADGFYGVEGNHDRAQALKKAMEDNGMVLLENQGVAVREGLLVAGLEDLWNRSPDVEKALAQAADDDFVLMLCHNPDTTMTQDFSRVDLALCGHVHGGEVTFFGLYAPAMPFVSQYGQKFVSGWCQSEAGTDVYVSNGIGPHFLRVFARPQVILLTLQAGEAHGPGQS